MFRFSLKKEEKEMIVRTINEIQELRAELSLLKNTLAGMGPQDRDTAGETAPEGVGEAAAALDGDTAAAGQGEFFESRFLPGDTGPDGEEESAAGPENTAAADSPAEDIQHFGQCSVSEEGTAPGQAGENMVDDSLAAPDAPAGHSMQEETVAGRDWAVVRLTERKRPWWKIWEPEKRETRRSI